MAHTPDPAAITVLLVDDESTLREPLVDYLVGQGFAVLEADSAFIAKPFSRADLARKIRAVLDDGSRSA